MTFMDMEVSELPSTHKLCYLGGCQFARSSVAYDYMGREVPANYPRFTHRVPDVTVSNLLSGNQSDGGDTLNPELLTLNQRTGTDALGTTSGFARNQGTETLESSTEQSHSGLKSLKVTTPGGTYLEGVSLGSISGLSIGTAYIGGGWIYAPSNSLLRYGVHAVNATNFTGTGDWQYVEFSFTATATSHSIILVTQQTTAQAITFYVDDLRLGKNDTTGFNTYTGGSGTTTISITPETSYTGYRCVKVTNSGFTNQGIQLSVSAGTQNNSMTFTAVVKGNAGVKLRLRMYQTTTGWLNDTSFTANGEWQKISLTNTFPITGSTWVYVSTDEAITTTFYVDQLMLETGSVAHDWAYGGSSYSTYKTEYGCLIEEAHTNLLTANQSTCGDTLGNTTGFGANQGTETLSSSTEEFIQGSKSLKCIMPGANSYEGISISLSTLTSATAYNYSAWVKAPVGEHFRVMVSGIATSYYTGNGEWQKVNVQFTSTGTTHYFLIVTNTKSAFTFYVDMLQLTATAYPLSWTLGGTTQASETLTAPSSVLNIDTEGYSNLLTANQSNVEIDLTGLNGYRGTFIRDTTIYKSGTASAKLTADGTGYTYIRPSTLTVLPGISYSFSVQSRIGDNSSTPINARIMWYQSDGSTFISSIDGVQTSSKSFTEVSVSGVAPALAGKAILVLQFYSTPNVGEELWWDEAQFTATPVVKPWIPGGTQVNSGSGTIEMEIYYNDVIKTGTVSKYILLYRNSTPTTRINIYRNGTTLIFATFDETTTGSSVAISESTISTGWHKFTMKWDINSLNVFMDGVQVGTPANNPKLPASSGGIITTYTTNQINSIIRNITISKPKRSDADVTARAAANVDGVGFPVDEDCTLIYPLKHDLSAYRVITR